MLVGQGCRCAICGSPRGARSLHVDHDHTTGKVRALLCGNCNKGIGNFQEDPDLLLAAAMYVLRQRDLLEVER